MPVRNFFFFSFFLRTISSVQNRSGKKAWVNLTAEAVLLWGKNYVALYCSPFLNRHSSLVILFF